MANSKVVYPEFIRDFLLSAERTALLFHLSYLRLGKFPKLKVLIREQAIETWILLGICEALLMKCALTSHTLATIAFPDINDGSAADHLRKAREWIDDIIRDVENLVNRFELQNRSVAECTSNVIKIKNEAQNQITQLSEQMKGLEADLGKLKEERKTNTKLLDETEGTIQKKNTELQDCIERISRNNNILRFFTALVPFNGPIAKFIVDTMSASDEAAHFQSLIADLNELSTEKIHLQNQEQSIQEKQRDLQFQLSKSNIEMGVIPNPDNLREIQLCLTQIQNNQLELKKFWEKAGSYVDKLPTMRLGGDADLLKGVQMYWLHFEQYCHDMQVVFRVQIQKVPHFLETDPSKLSQEDWAKEYQSVMEKLSKISP